MRSTATKNMIGIDLTITNKICTKRFEGKVVFTTGDGDRLGSTEDTDAVLLLTTTYKNRIMTNKVIDSMMSHRSIRAYTDEPVDEKELDCIIRAVQAAPNWVNLQLVSMVAIKDAERRKMFSGLCGDQPHIAEAPVFLVFCTDYHRVVNT